MRKLEYEKIFNAVVGVFTNNLAAKFLNLEPCN